MNTSTQIPLNSFIRLPCSTDTLNSISCVLRFVSNSCLNSTGVLTDGKVSEGLHIVLEEVIDALDYVINCLDGEELEVMSEPEKKAKKIGKAGKKGR